MTMFIEMNVDDYNVVVLTLLSQRIIHDHRIHHPIMLVEDI